MSGCSNCLHFVKFWGSIEVLGIIETKNRDADNVDLNPLKVTMIINGGGQFW